MCDIDDGIQEQFDECYKSGWNNGKEAGLDHSLNIIREYFYEFKDDEEILGFLMDKIKEEKYREK